MPRMVAWGSDIPAAEIASGAAVNRGSAGDTAGMASSLAASAGRLQELTGRFTV